MDEIIGRTAVKPITEPGPTLWVPLLSIVLIAANLFEGAQ